MFVHKGTTIRFLEREPSLFAWMGEACNVEWSGGVTSKGAMLPTKSEFFSHLKATVENHDAVEAYPHEPKLKGHYYTWQEPKGYLATGKYLNGLLAFFDNARTDQDEALVRAMFLTPAWGGAVGTRPAFAIQAPDRGCGKSTLADVLGVLYGGAIDVELSPNQEFRIKERILAPSSLTRRVVRLDNLKGTCKSAQLENLITCTEVNGHRLHSGDSRRPNILTYVLTGNGLQLSRDMAQRCFIIHLKKPDYRPEWREEVMTYVENNRDRILADIVAELQRDPEPTRALDRWGDFVAKVLARCTKDAKAVVNLNQERRDDGDEDVEEAEAIMAAFDSYMDSSQIPEQTSYIESSRATLLINAALNETWSQRKVAQTIKSHIEAGRLKRVEHERRRQSRGFKCTRLDS